MSWQKVLERSNTKKTFFVLLALGAGSFFVRLFALLSQAHPFGYDGYYYVTQLTRYVISGHLHTPESSWVIWLMVPVRLLVGDSILAVKLSSALLVALCVPGAYLAVQAIGKRLSSGQNDEAVRLAPWLAAMWAAGSPVLSLLAAEFPKNLGMVTAGLFFWAVWWSKPGGRMHWVWISILALLTMTAHRLGVLLIAIPITATVLEYFLHFGDHKSRRSWALAVVILAIAFLFGTLSYLLPNLLHPSDLERLKGALSNHPSLLPLAYFHLWSPSLALKIELSAGWPLLILMGWGIVRKMKAWPLLMIFSASFILCNFPFWETSHLDLGYRLGLLGPLFTFISSFMLLHFRVHGVNKPRRSGVVLSLIVGAVSLSLAPLGMQTNRMPPYDRYMAMISLIPKPYPKKTIAHSGMNFYYGHLTRHPAVAWAPLASEDSSKIYRIAWGISDGQWLEFLENHDVHFTPMRLDPDYTYLREDDWEAFVTWARESKDSDLLDRIFSNKNPNRKKPAYLQRNWKENTKKTSQ